MFDRARDYDYGFMPVSFSSQFAMLSPTSQERIARLVAAIRQAEGRREMIASLPSPSGDHLVVRTLIPTTAHSTLRLVKG